ncbi:unnamed protein product [Tenebrio molitor]|nr:unnamed protein product [Tenebrio molitor]
MPPNWVIVCVCFEQIKTNQLNLHKFAPLNLRFERVNRAKAAPATF